MELLLFYYINVYYSVKYGGDDMFTGQKHKERFLNEIETLKQSNSYFNRNFLSALYTITSDDFLWETSKNSIKYNYIDFNQINIRGISVNSH